METKKQEENYAIRSSKNDRFDRRLILKIVREVEEGLPRKDAERVYKLRKSSLDRWMQRYGSEHYHQNLKRKSYSQLQKRTIVTAIEQGRMTIREARAAHGIRTEKTIRDWLLRHKDEKVVICIENTSPMPKDRPSSKDLKKEALLKALQEAELKIKALNTLIDVAEEQLKIDIRKKSGAKQS